MSEAFDRGIAVTELAALDEPIEVCPETTAAFVGRALRGPLNTPVLVQNFGEFRRHFGDVWTHSSLGPAARQFFAHGGHRLYIVRVANNARGALLVLPASGSALVLRAVQPGSSEQIRAAVDYDGIDVDDERRFNLTLQRLDPQTGLVLDQEFYQRVAWRREDNKFVADSLLGSNLARVAEPLPTHRPERTLAAGSVWESGYVLPEQAGSDGGELSSYDLIGSRSAQTGLFALEQVDGFDLLYMPPPGRESDAGPAAVLAADQYCRERGAMLIVDPPAAWRDADEAVDGMRQLGYASANLCGYFPRLVERNGDGLARAAGGAIAGSLCKQDRMAGPWHDPGEAGLGLGWEWQPAAALERDDERRLLRAGLNIVRQQSGGRARVAAAVTMGQGREAERRFARLHVRRLCLRIVNSLAAATRWTLFEPPTADLAERAAAQMHFYFERLFGHGALASEHFLIQCEVDADVDPARRGLTILVLFTPAGCREPLSLTIHTGPQGCRVGSTAFGLTIRR